MKKIIYITIAVVIAVIAIVGYLHFVVGGSEDDWICDDGQWVKHGAPSTPMPTSGCGETNINTITNATKNTNTPIAQWPLDTIPCSERATDIVPIGQKYVECESDEYCKLKQTSSCPECLNVIYECVPTSNDSAPNQFNWSTMNEGPYKDSVTYATSTDLLNWTPSNDILASHASVPGAVMKDGTIFVYFVDVSTNGIKEQLGMVKSIDQGKTWSEATILTIEDLGDKATADPAAVVTDDGQIRLYYFDINEARGKVFKKEPINKIYSAISDDGINFTQEDGVRFERESAFDPDVLWVDGTWYMYTGDLQGNKVNVATSTDGLTFTHQGVAYNGGAVPDVWHEDGNWYLYTAGINIATGTAGMTFESSGYDFYDPNSHVTADPSVIQLNDGTYLMLYKVQE